MAAALPIPLVEPVTSAVLPFRSVMALFDSGPKIRPWLGARQRPAARQRHAGLWVTDGDLAGCGQELAGVGVDGLDGDLVAEAFQAADVVAGLAAGVHALFVVVGAEVGVAGGGVGQQGVDDGERGV